MSRVWFIADLHLGHRNILEFSPNRDGSDIEEHDAILEARWCTTVGKRDIVWVLGDVAFSTEKLQAMKDWPGQKKLVRGNHDKLNERLYRDVFDNIYGILSYKGFWLSHAPVHPDELRGKKSIHGHIHNEPIRFKDGSKDDRYIPVCVEQTCGWPIDFNELRSR